MFGVRPCCLHLCLGVSFSEHFTERDADGGTPPLKPVCVCKALLSQELMAA